MSIENAHYFNVLIGAGVIFLQVFSAILLLLLIFNRENVVLIFVKKHFVPIGFLITLAAFLVSAFYSEILHYLPCRHCWIQRIFMFPQVLLFAVAWLRKERNVFWYSLTLTFFGLLDAIYLVYIYYFKVSSAPCDASGISCTLHYVSEFGGYISIPSMALSGFLALAILLLVVYYKKDE